jgi:hypothetical protein
MTRQTSLTGQNDIVLDHGATGETCLRHYQAAFAYPYVVSHLYEVVNLGALADHGITQATSIDRCIGADLDVGLDDTATDVSQR